MSITPLPTPPSRLRPTTFADEADLFLSALPPFGTECNALAEDVSDKQSITSAAATVAVAAKDAAKDSEEAAAASAASAVLSPGTSASSSDSLTIGQGLINLTITTGKSFVLGMSVVIASSSSPLNWMTGVITSIDNSTGAMAVNVSTVAGGGTFSSWVISLSAPTMRINGWVQKTTNYQAIPGDKIIAEGSIEIAAPKHPLIGDSLAVRQGTLPFESHPVTITSADNIMGDPSLIIDTNDLIVELVFNGTEWRI